MMYGCRRPRIIVEADPKLLKGRLNNAVVLIYKLFWRNTLLFRLHGYGHPVLIAAADKGNIPALKSLIARINISGHIYTGQMPYMKRAIGIGKGGRNSVSLGF